MEHRNHPRLRLLITGAGGSAIWGHIYALERLYNWNNAKAAMGLSTAVCFTLTGIVLILTGNSLERIRKTLGAR